jgi:hypothetical protein
MLPYFDTNSALASSWSIKCGLTIGNGTAFAQAVIRSKARHIPALFRIAQASQIKKYIKIYIVRKLAVSIKEGTSMIYCS